MFMRDIIREEIKSFLLEDIASVRAKAAREFLVNSDYKDHKPFDFVNVYIKKTFQILKDSKCRYIKGLTRMGLNGELGNIKDKCFTNEYNISKIRQILKYFYNLREDPKIKNINDDLDGMTAKDLINEYYNIVLEYDADVIKTLKYNNNNKTGYTIVETTNFEESSEYSAYVDWCVTQDYNLFKITQIMENYHFSFV